MQKHIMIGVNEYDRCCILECLLSFEQLDIGALEASDFKHSATNWSGCDDLSRTLKVKDLTPTGKEIVLKAPLMFYGADYDHGHETKWTMTITKILEVVAL